MAGKREVRGWLGKVILIGFGLGLGMPLVGSAQTREVLPGQAIEGASRSFVIVHYHLKKSDRPFAEDRTGFAGDQTSILQRVLNRNTLDVVGLLLGDKGEVLISGQESPTSDVISHLTVTGPDGREVPAQADRLLIRTPAKVIRLINGLPGTWRALSFTELGEVTADTALYAVMMRLDEQKHLYIRPCEYGLGWNAATAPSPCLRLSEISGVAVICNAQGLPVGLTTRAQIDLGPTGPVWRGKDILADSGLSIDQQRQLEDRLEKEFAKAIYQIKITFRPQPDEEEGSDYRVRMAYGPFGPEGGSTQERVMYGLGIAEDKVLVPATLSREEVAGIDTLGVVVEDRQIPARFGGVLKECRVMVIELQEGNLPRTTAFAEDRRIRRIEPFWTVLVRDLAGKDVRVDYSRWIDRMQGYGDRWYPVVERSVQFGSWLFDRQGRLVGLCSEARYEHDRLESYLMGRSYDRYRSFSSSSPSMRMSRMGPFPIPSGFSSGYSSSDRTRLFEAAELSGILTHLADHYDPSIRHLSKEEQKRRVWLGVEYTRPGREMVKQMDLRSQTQDGRIGLIVNRIYAGSPAARIGLSEGDLLLKIAVPGMSWPIDLAFEEQGGYSGPDFEEGDVPEEFRAMGLRMPHKRPWPSRDNAFTRMLADIGAGTSVTLIYLHEGRMLEKEFVIEPSPPDMLSAAKYKNEKLGLTVKDLTYEVRAALRLNEKDVAVVITAVEQGRPAALARINPYELIRAVDDQPVNNVQTFEKLITEAQQAKKDSVRLTVEWMGKTRLADLKFEAKGGMMGGLLRSLTPGLE